MKDGRRTLKHLRCSDCGFEPLRENVEFRSLVGFFFVCDCLEYGRHKSHLIKYSQICDGVAV